MNRVKRFTGIALVTAMMMFIIAPAATAVDQQYYVGPGLCWAVFDAPDLPNGTVYDLTINDTTYSVTAIDSYDKSVQVPIDSTVTWSVQNIINVDASHRYSYFYTTRTSPFTITSDTIVTMNYESQILITADQTGLPTGTEYYFNHMMAISTDLLVAGTPFDFWGSIFAGTCYIVYDFQNPVYTEFGQYPLFGSAPQTGYGFTEPGTIMATYASGSVDGQVYNDLNNNGVRDPGETGIAGATVELLGGGVLAEGSLTQAIPSGLEVFGTVTSDENGDYSFDGVPAGTFYVRITLPNGGIQESPPIELVITGSGVTNGTTDFPQGVAGPSTLPYTGR